jgi:hypothetical protein
MRPEIEAYLRQHGARYTSEALRRRLIDAGHDAAEVDAALRESESTRSALLSDRQAFDRWALWLHIGAFVALILMVVLLNGIQGLGAATIAAIVLSIFLALGWKFSSLIGNALLSRAGLLVALIFPGISALGLGGTCLWLMGALPGVSN